MYLYIYVCGMAVGEALGIVGAASMPIFTALSSFYVVFAA